LFDSFESLLYGVHAGVEEMLVKCLSRRWHLASLQRLLQITCQPSPS